MAVRTLTLGRREYVLVPKHEYERVQAQLEEDAREVRLARKALSHYRRTGQGISLEALKKERR